MAIQRTVTRWRKCAMNQGTGDLTLVEVAPTEYGVLTSIYGSNSHESETAALRIWGASKTEGAELFAAMLPPGAGVVLTIPAGDAPDAGFGEDLILTVEGGAVTLSAYGNKG